MRRRPWQSVLLYAAVLLLVIVTMGPLVWLFIMSVASAQDLTALPLRWIPEHLSFERYAKLLSLSDDRYGRAFLYALRNSLAVAGVATVVALVAGIPAAYSFSRFRGRMGLLYFCLGVYMIPPVAFVLPLYMIFGSLGLLNTLSALVIVYCTILLPFSTWLLKNNFDTVPQDIEHAGRLDGLGLIGVIRHVTLPLAKPAIGTAALFALLLAWDEFFYGLIYTNSIAAKTLPVAISDFAAGRTTDYGLISAVGVLAALPPFIIASFLQRALVSGLSSGGMKG
jgi:multiple sugar transport system permease protein